MLSRVRILIVNNKQYTFDLLYSGHTPTLPIWLWTGLHHRRISIANIITSSCHHHRPEPNSDNNVKPANCQITSLICSKGITNKIAFQMHSPYRFDFFCAILTIMSLLLPLFIDTLSFKRNKVARVTSPTRPNNLPLPPLTTTKHNKFFRWYSYDLLNFHLGLPHSNKEE